MVVVGMCPTRGIDLTGGNTHRTQGSHREGGFLTATAVCGLDRSQRRAGAGIRRGIDHLLVAPVVHLQHRIVERQVLHPVFQLREENRTAVIQVLVVHTHREDKMTEDLFRNAFSPRHLGFRLEGSTHITQIKRPVVIGQVADRHVGIEEGQGLLLGWRHLLVKHFEQIAIRQGYLFRLEILLYLSPISGIRDEMGAVATTYQQ